MTWRSPPATCFPGDTSLTPIRFVYYTGAVAITAVGVVQLIRAIRAQFWRAVIAYALALLIVSVGIVLGWNIVRAVGGPDCGSNRN